MEIKTCYFRTSVFLALRPLFLCVLMWTLQDYSVILVTFLVSRPITIVFSPLFYTLLYVIFDFAGSMSGHMASSSDACMVCGGRGDGAHFGAREACRFVYLPVIFDFILSWDTGTLPMFMLKQFHFFPELAPPSSVAQFRWERCTNAAEAISVQSKRVSWSAEKPPSTLDWL